MPDGGYPIRNASDLQNAIQAFGRANDKPEVKACIKKRAKELNLERMLPSSWEVISHAERTDGHMWTCNSEDSLSHHGIIGMKWGHNRVSSIGSQIQTTKSRGAKDVESFRPYTKTGIATKNGKQVMTPEDVKGAIKGVRSNTNKTVSRLEKKQQKVQSNMDSHMTKRTQNAVNKLSNGKTLARSLVFGSYGALVYTALKAKGVSTGKAAAQATLNAWGNTMTLGHLAKTSKW